MSSNRPYSFTDETMSFKMPMRSREILHRLRQSILVLIPPCLVIHWFTALTELLLWYLTLYLRCLLSWEKKLTPIVLEQISYSVTMPSMTSVISDVNCTRLQTNVIKLSVSVIYDMESNYRCYIFIDTRPRITVTYLTLGTHLLSYIISYITWASWGLSSPGIWLFLQQLVQANSNKKSLKIHIAATLWGNPLVSDGFLSQRASNMESVLMP